MSLTRRGRLVVVLVTLTCVLLAGTAGAYIYLRSVGVYGSSDPGRVVTVVIPEGANASDIGDLLAAEEIVKSAVGFRIASFLEGGAEDIQAGTYQLPTGLNARDALEVMVEDGPVVETFTVTFPEGSWLIDFAEILESDAALDADAFLDIVRTPTIKSRIAPDAPTLEGLLFPSTYEFAVDATARSIVARLVSELEERVRELDLSEARSKGYSAYEVVTIASLVEAEAKVDADRDKIAAVIYNRLDEGMRLEIDATVFYALGFHKEVLTESDLAVDSPYNTRVVAGLPPTPIGAPGMASLEAAANPADGDWLFYVVADCDGRHAFSVDYDDFLADKAAYQALEC